MKANRLPRGACAALSLIRADTPGMGTLLGRVKRAAMARGSRIAPRPPSRAALAWGGYVAPDRLSYAAFVFGGMDSHADNLMADYWL